VECVGDLNGGVVHRPLGWIGSGGDSAWAEIDRLASLFAMLEASETDEGRIVEAVVAIVVRRV